MGLTYGQLAHVPHGLHLLRAAINFQHEKKNPMKKWAMFNTVCMGKCVECVNPRGGGDYSLFATFNMNMDMKSWTKLLTEETSE